MSDKENPYKLGMQAAQMGEPERANPYRRGTPAWTRWLGGWRNAHELAHQRAQHERKQKELAQ